MSRAQRRADVARFRREARRGVVSYLVDRDDARLAGEPLLRNAIEFWRANLAVRKPKCFDAARRLPLTGRRGHF